MAGPVFFGGQLLFRNGMLAMSEACCCRCCCPITCDVPLTSTRVTFVGSCAFVGGINWTAFTSRDAPLPICDRWVGGGAVVVDCPPVGEVNAYSIEPTALWCPNNESGPCDYILEVVIQPNVGSPTTVYPALIEVDCENGRLWFGGFTAGCCTITEVRVNLCADEDPGAAPGTGTIC